MSRWYDKFVAFDTETTGFDKDARILELAVLTYENGVCVAKYSTLFNPKGVNWDDPNVRKALSINHIEVADLEGAPQFSECAEYLKKLLTDTPVWCAHNLPFDERMLRQEFSRIGMELDVNATKLDTMILDTEFNPAKRGRKLLDVAERWNVSLLDSHEAYADALCCAEILLKMQKEESPVWTSAETANSIVTTKRAKWDAAYRR